MLDSRSNEYWIEKKARKEVLDSHFLAGRIGESTYIVSLMILRFTEREAKQELEMLKMEKRR